MNVEDVFMGRKSVELNAVNGLICLLKAVGFSTYSNFTLEYKRPK